MRFEDLKPLLEWRVSTLKEESLTPERLVQAFSVEELPKVDPQFEKMLVGFRKRNQSERIAVARKFLSHNLGA